MMNRLRSPEPIITSNSFTIKTSLGAKKTASSYSVWDKHSVKYSDCIGIFTVTGMSAKSVVSLGGARHVALFRKAVAEDGSELSTGDPMQSYETLEATGVIHPTKSSLLIAHMIPIHIIGNTSEPTVTKKGFLVCWRTCAGARAAVSHARTRCALSTPPAHSARAPCRVQAEDFHLKGRGRTFMSVIDDGMRSIFAGEVAVLKAMHLEPEARKPLFGNDLFKLMDSVCGSADFLEVCPHVIPATTLPLPCPCTRARRSRCPPRALPCVWCGGQVGLERIGAPDLRSVNTKSLWMEQLFAKVKDGSDEHLKYLLATICKSTCDDVNRQYKKHGDTMTTKITKNAADQEWYVHTTALADTLTMVNASFTPDKVKKLLAEAQEQYSPRSVGNRSGADADVDSVAADAVGAP